VFQGANEKEIGLLLKIAGLTWVKDALELRTAKLEITDADVNAILADIKPERIEEGKVQLLTDVTLNDLGARGMSQATKDIHGRIREFIAAAARELVQREMTSLGHEVNFHQTEDAELSRVEADGVQGGAQAAREVDGHGSRPSCSATRSFRRWPERSARSRRRTSMPRRWSCSASPESRRSARCGSATGGAARRSPRRSPWVPCTC
jgi:hypothetical protein